MESHKRLLFVHIAQIDRPTMGLTAGFSAKSTPFNIYSQIVYISSFFHFFPKPRPVRDTRPHMPSYRLQV